MSVSINCKLRSKVEIQVHRSYDLFVVICEIYMKNWSETLASAEIDS